MKKNKRIIGLISVIVSGGLIAWLLSRLDFDSVSAVFRNAQLIYLGMALGITCIIPVAAVFRWRGVLRAQDIKFPLWGALKAVLMANVLNSFLPSKGGDLVKAVYLRDHGGVAAGVGTVILERLTDLFILGLLGVIGSVVCKYSWGLLFGSLLSAGVLGIILGAVLFQKISMPLPKKIQNKLNDLSSVFMCWVRCPTAIIQTVTASSIVWSCAGLTVVFLCKAFNANIDSGYAFAIFPLCVLAGLLPVTLSGIGTRDAAFVQLLVGAGVSLETATMIGIGYTLFAYWILSLVSLPVVALELIDYYRKER